MQNEQAFIIKKSSLSRCNAFRKTSLVPAPTPLSRLRDFHSIDSAQKDSVPSLQEVAETFVCAPIKRPERQWPLTLTRQRPQTFLMGRAEPEDCHSASASSSGTPNIRQFSLRITETRPCYPPPPLGAVIDSATFSEMRRKHL